MAGAGRRTFQPGEVLTASNVNSYLMDQSVMRFADSTARGSAIGTAVIAEGMVSYLDDTNVLEVYDGAAWNTVYTPSALPIVRGGTGGTTVAEAQDNLAIGLVPIVPTSVDKAGASSAVTIDSLGRVTYTACTSFSLNGVFTSEYENYKMILTSQVSTSSVVCTMRMRSAGTDNTGVYVFGATYTKITGGSPVPYASTSSNHLPAIACNSGATGPLSTSMDIIRPQIASATSVNLGGYWADSVSAFGIALAGLHGAGSYDGFTIATGVGTISGTVQIYGYKI